MKKLALVAWVALAFAAVGSQLAAQAGKGVTVMVRAVSDDGQPVLDLKPADVSLKVNGKAREIKSLTLMKFGGAPAAPAGGAPAAPSSGAPAPFSTNAGGAITPSADPSRVVMIAIDDESFVAGNEQPARDAAQQLVDALAPADRIGVLTIPHGNRGLSPTSDRAAVKAALAALAGRGASGEEDNDLACRTAITLQSVRGVLQTMPSDEPGVVVFFSGGMAGPSTTSAKAGSRDSSASCAVSMAEYQNVASVAQGGGSAFYVVHLKDAMAGNASRMTSLTSGIENLASTSNAPFIRFAGRGEGAMARVPKETTAFYAASFDPDPADKGATAKVELRSSRDKVKVRAASEVSLRVAEVAAGGKAPSPKDMVRDLKAYRDLPLRATTMAQRNTGDDRIKVIVLFEPDAGTLTAATIGMVDDKGKLTAQWTAQDTDLAKSPIFAVLAAPAGTYRVRVAATDATGKGGAVDDSFTAGLTSAGANLKLSGLSLWSQNDKGLVPKLQFSTETEAIAMFELYGRPAGKMGAQIQIATSPDGPPINKEPIQVGAAGTSEPDRFTLTAKVPIGDLAPGDYVIRAMVTEEGQPETKIMRTLRKVAK